MTDAITIRRSRTEDGAALRELALLDDRHPLKGEALLAFVGGQLRAAVSLDSEGAVADPFHRTSDVVQLLQLRAAQEQELAA